MHLVEMTLAQSRDEATRYGTTIDLIDAAMMARGCSRQFMLESHLMLALGYCSEGLSDPSGFRRIRESIDELEKEVLVLRENLTA